MSEVKTIEETVELGEAELKQISDAVSKNLKEGFATTIEEATKAAAEATLKAHLEATDTIEKKQLADKGDKKKAADAGGEDGESFIKKGIAEGRFSEEITKEAKELRFLKAARALATGDLSTLKSYNEHSLAQRAEIARKAGYANEGLAVDGQVLVPDPEFDTTIYENLPKYGVAFQYADVRRTDRTAVYAITLDSGLVFYPTAEAGVKKGAKMSFSRKLVSLQKYAVIVPATDELTDDAAIDYWNLVTKELSRAYGKLADEITFTDATYGITNQAGVITEPVSGAGTTINWGDLLDAEGKTEDDLDTSGYRWFMRKETWFRLIQLKGSTNDHYIAGSLVAGWSPSPNSPQTPWGTPVTFVRVLPTSGASAGSPGVVGANDAFAVYGDLEHYKLYQKNGMEMTMLQEGIVKDADGNDFNLATQDGHALRAVVRLLGMLPKGNAPKFVIVGTGTVS